MRRKRRTKYTWLPAYGTGIDVGGTNYETHLRFGTLGVLRTGAPATGIVAVIPDAATENFDASSHLTDAITQEYILRRIVGKLHISYEQNSNEYVLGNPYIPEAVIVTAGFFVARENDVSQVDPEGSPIGYTNGVNVADFNNYSPQARDTQREPWIWRRQWILGNQQDARFRGAGGPANLNQTSFGGWETYPPNTAACGSVADGPHLDCKTVRRVNQDDRLWFVITNQCISNGIPANDGNLSYVLDARYLGALRKARQRGAF